MVAVLQPIGRAFLGGLESTGRLSVFAGGGVIAALKPPYYPRLILRQMIEIGFYSLPVVGLFGGYLVCVYTLGFNPTTYINNTWDFVQPLDVISGLVKAAVFGFMVALMGCYHGYHSKGGAQGVGAATTNAVVTASILILTFNYLITEAFFSK